MKLAGIETDIDLELSVKPVIQEMVRTQVCFPNLKLLVDRIAIVTLLDVDELSGNEAYKLTLTDGEKTIQALLKRRQYKTIYYEDVREGSFVILKVYHLAQGKKVNGEGYICYLVIEDFYSIGEDERYDVAPDTHEESVLEESEPGDTETRNNAPTSKQLDMFGRKPRESERPAQARAGDKVIEEEVENHSQISIENVGKEKASPTSPTSQQRREAMKRKWDTALEEIDTNDTYRISKYRRLEEARAREAHAAADASAKAFITRYESLPTTPLVAITGPNKRRNTHHDILALIVSVSPDIIKRPGMPPKRDLRIMDISTIKKVSLSVFADAGKFNPAPGTVALFKHLTAHDYDGGSLNAYAKDCRGPDWFIPDPPGFENGEVAQLKDCWARIQYSESVAREPEDYSEFSEANKPLYVPEGEDIADHLPPVSGKKHLTCFYWAKNGTCRYTDDECAYAHYNTGVVAHDPMRNQTIITTNTTSKDNDDNNEKVNTGLPLSKSLTCFFWARNRKCNRSDEECSYAHYDTGTVARPPPGMTVFEPSEEKDTTSVTKGLTCYFWNRNGKCKRSEEECPYAHHHTGTVAYPPPAVAAASSSISASKSTAQQPSSSGGGGGKTLTCFFWARNGHCMRSDAECGYAHYDTGVVANNPTQSFTSPSVPGHVKLGAPFKANAITSAAAAPVSAPGAAATSNAALSNPPSVSTSSTTTTNTLVPPPPLPPPLLPPPSAATTTTIDPPPPPPPAPPSTKNQTCYFWANFGKCKRSDQECRYAHFHAGRMAVNPIELKMKRR
ncbi:MAG: hypothetical protein LQ350_002812 [Teloschistes chrysophthalmus]|nr:MAG: hypothetical protein LQ350_002812 [Niorma chrysophthalma]